MPPTRPALPLRPSVLCASIVLVLAITPAAQARSPEPPSAWDRLVQQFVNAVRPLFEAQHAVEAASDARQAVEPNPSLVAELLDVPNRTREEANRAIMAAVEAHAAAEAAGRRADELARSRIDGLVDQVTGASDRATELLDAAAQEDDPAKRRELLEQADERIAAARAGTAELDRLARRHSVYDAIPDLAGAAGRGSGHAHEQLDSLQKQRDGVDAPAVDGDASGDAEQGEQDEQDGGVVGGNDDEVEEVLVGAGDPIATNQLGGDEHGKEQGKELDPGVGIVSRPGGMAGTAESILAVQDEHSPLLTRPLTPMTPVITLSGQSSTQRLPGHPRRCAVRERHSRIRRRAAEGHRRPPRIGPRGGGRRAP